MSGKCREIPVGIRSSWQPLRVEQPISFPGYRLETSYQSQSLMIRPGCMTKSSKMELQIPRKKRSRSDLHAAWRVNRGGRMSGRTFSQLPSWHLGLGMVLCVSGINLTLHESAVMWYTLDMSRPSSCPAGRRGGGGKGGRRSSLL